MLVHSYQKIKLYTQDMTEAGVKPGKKKQTAPFLLFSLYKMFLSHRQISLISDKVREHINKTFPFFYKGGKKEETPEDLCDFEARGHELGPTTWTSRYKHPDGVEKEEASMVRELVCCIIYKARDCPTWDLTRPYLPLKE